MLGSCMSEYTVHVSTMLKYLTCILVRSRIWHLLWIRIFPTNDSAEEPEPPR